MKSFQEQLKKTTHKEAVHQYVVREAYNLLKARHGTVPDMDSHVGLDEVGERPWQTKKIVTGAWREDVEDVVYNISMHEELMEMYPPPIGALFDYLVQLFGGVENPLVSVTHFWNADVGQSSPVWIPVDAGPFGLVTFGPFPNAFQKIKAYEGGKSWILRYRDGFGPHQSQFQRPDGSFFYYNWLGEIGFEYACLSELYTTGRAWIVGTYAEDGEWIPCNIEVRLGTGWREVMVWEILGRMAHLITDMSVPAHAHNDEHGTKADRYEDWMASGYSYWNWQKVQSEVGGPINAMAYADPLFLLQYTTNQIADHYASEDSNGDDVYDNIGGLGTIIPPLGPPETMAQINEDNLDDIRESTFPYAIRATAGLLYWFAVQTGLLPQPDPLRVYVPGDYPTIATALAVVTSGQTVDVSAGTHSVASTLTVASGITLNLRPGVTLNFSPSTSLTVNGKLLAIGTSAQHIRFTSPSASYWTGTMLSGSGANMSRLDYCDFTYASSPLVISNALNVYVNYCTFGNSNFRRDPYDAAISVYNTTAYITYSTVNGQSDSWNGVRFADYAHGYLQNCVIQNCGAGNGVVCQTGGQPFIHSSTIRNNYYNGVLLVTGAGLSIDNSLLENNGVISGQRTYSALRVNNSSATSSHSNTIRGSAHGIYSETYGYVNARPGNAYNTYTTNTYGLVGYYGSTIESGYDSEGYYVFDGGCNNIYGNYSYDALATSNSFVVAEANWWGQAPPNYSKIGADGSSFVDSYYYLSQQGVCDSWAMLGTIDSPVLSANPQHGEEVERIDIVKTLLSARRAISKGDFVKAREAYKLLLAQAEDTPKAHGLVGLYNLLRRTKDVAILDDILGLTTGRSNISRMALEILPGAFIALEDKERAKTAALELKSQYPGSPSEAQALLLLVTLGDGSAEAAAASQTYANELKSKFGSTLDAGLIAALGSGLVNPESKESLSEEASGTLSCYPNPFNPSVTIKFELATQEMVTLRLYDIVGRELATLVNDLRQPGVYTVNWDAAGLPSGMYFARLDMVGKTHIQKLLLLK